MDPGSLHPPHRLTCTLPALSGLCLVTNDKKNVRALLPDDFSLWFFELNVSCLPGGITGHVRWFGRRQRPEELPFKPSDRAAAYTRPAAPMGEGNTSVTNIPTGGECECAICECGSKKTHPICLRSRSDILPMTPPTTLSDKNIYQEV